MTKSGTQVTPVPPSAKGGRVKALFIVGPYASLPALIFQLEQWTATPEQVAIFVYRKDQYHFLGKLKSLGFWVTFCNPLPTPKIRELGKWMATKLEISRLRRRLRAEVTSAKVFLWTTAMDLGPMAAAVCLSDKQLKNTLLYDGSFEFRTPTNPIFEKTCTGPRAAFKSWLVSSLIGAPIKFYRPWSPVAALQDDYIRARFTAFNSDVSTVRKTGDVNIVLNTLRLADPCRVLWLFTDLPHKYRFSPEEAKSFYEAWESLLQIALQAIPSKFHAIKGHPSYGNTIPHAAREIRQIDHTFPMEFLEFPNLKVALGGQSLSMRSLVMQKPARVVSILPLLPLPEQVAIIQSNALREHQLASPSIGRIANLEDFRKTMESVARDE